MTLDEIVHWFKARREPQLSKGSIQELLHLLHPRGLFLKTLPKGATLLDMGAGDGGLAILKAWPFPPRPDIKLYAYSLSKGENFRDYDGYEIGNWEEARPVFKGITFDAIFCSHFIEHISDPRIFLQWCREKLAPQGRLYLEWPSPHSLQLPSRTDLEAAGVNLIISNYRDDHTHRELPERQKILGILEELGFTTEQTGFIHLPFLEDELLAHFAAKGRNGYEVQAAFWSKTLWAQFIVAFRHQ
ncbi:MAG: methyltransferase domain-containing protein [Gammaproteobacteria bacterium]